MLWSLVDSIRSQEATYNTGTDEDEKGLWIFKLTYPVARLWD
jgi:hypothetical protein